MIRTFSIVIFAAVSILSLVSSMPIDLAIVLRNSIMQQDTTNATIKKKMMK
jgi:hypothetical protein